MDAVVMRIGGAMGWLIERAKKQQRNLATAGTIASKAWKDSLKGALGGKEQLANRLRQLDEGEGVEWWLGPKGKPYLHAVARVLKVEAVELITWIEDARPAPDDDARWFHFEVFPGLRPLDLDTEDPYPGIPVALLRGDGPRGPTWWHAPPGAGRTLLGRWLGRRHGWTVTHSLREAAERTFIEHDGPALADLRLPDRIVVAAPHPMPERLRLERWEEVRCHNGWEIAFVDWVNNRLAPDGRLDAIGVRIVLEDGRLATSTPGSLLEALAELNALGPDVLSDRVSAARALDEWARAHASRSDRAIRPASREWLREHGGWLLPRVELERLRRGLPVSRQDLMSCMPELPAASADAIREAHDAGNVDAALALLCPGKGEIVAAMEALRWILEAEWGLPSRVRHHLHRSVVELAVDQGDPRTLGTLLDRPDAAADVVLGLARPVPFTRWTDVLSAAAATDPKTALVADGLLKAFALLAGGDEAKAGDLAGLLATALRQVYGSPCPDLAVHARVEDAETWTSIAWLALHRLDVLDDPPPERISSWAWNADHVLRWHETPPGSTRRRLQCLAADTLGALAFADRLRSMAPEPVAGLVALATEEVVDPSELQGLHELNTLEIVVRLSAPWAASIEEVCSLLWPVWTCSGIPHEPDAAKLAKVWATYPHTQVEGRLSVQLVDHAAMGVELPDRLWPLAIELAPHNAELLARAPIELLLQNWSKSPHAVASAVWERAPERALRLIDGCVENALKSESWPWFTAIPGEQAPQVLALVDGRVHGAAGVRLRQWWADRAIRERVSGWERIWEWVRSGER